MTSPSTSSLLVIVASFAIASPATGQTVAEPELRFSPGGESLEVCWERAPDRFLRRSTSYSDWIVLWETLGAESYHEAVGARVFFSTGVVRSQFRKPPHKVVGHRGGTGRTHPENTLISWEEGARLGLRSIEADINLSSDGHLFVMHDLGAGGLRRTTDVEDVFPDRRNDRPEMFTIEELKQLDAGAWKNSRFAGEQIPTLKEFLNFCSLHSITPVLDVKGEYHAEIREECMEIGFPISKLHIHVGLGFTNTLTAFVDEALYITTFSYNEFVIHPETAPIWYINQFANRKTDGVIALGSIQEVPDIYNPGDWDEWKIGGVAPIYYLANSVAMADLVFSNGFLGVWTDNVDRFTGTDYLKDDL